MVGKSLRSLTVFGLLVAAAAAPFLTNCASPTDDDDEASEDAVTGVNNALGLALVYDADTGRVHATLKEPLKTGEQLYLRVRRGTITHESQKQLDCGELASAPPVKDGARLGGVGKMVYEGPVVSDEILHLVSLFNDPRWYGGRETPEMQAEVDKGPDPIVEACVMSGDKVKARLLTNLAYAWDRGNDLKKMAGSLGSSSLSGRIQINGENDPVPPNSNVLPEQVPAMLELLNDPATTLEILDDKVGLDRRAAQNLIKHRDGADGVFGTADDDKFDDLAEIDGVSRVGASALKKIRNYALANQNPRLREGERYSTIDYANLCVQKLGEIPFFKKLGNGKYDSFDCRDFVGSNEDGESQGPIDGVEGAVVPLTIDDVEQTECSPGRSSSRTYDCVDKCDQAMWLTASSHTGLGRKAACQPGVTVTTAKNDKGTHWILLCRKVEARSGTSMMRTKTFNDIAIIGNNPVTGETCFFQNKENVGNDGSRVTHPADVQRSSAIWPSEPSSYCTKNCHTADAFVHSPWIDAAKRSDGTPIVPMVGKHRDYPISALDRPYRLINGPAQGFSVAPHMVSEEVAVCTTCHRVAGAAFGEFAEWSVGKGDQYYGKITDSYKAFEKSHWMPPRLDGLNADNFDSSVWGKAVSHIRACTDNANAPGCEFSTIPEE